MESEALHGLADWCAMYVDDPPETVGRMGPGSRWKVRTSDSDLDSKERLYVRDGVEDRGVRAAREEEADSPVPGVYDKGAAVASLGHGARDNLIPEAGDAESPIRHPDRDGDRRHLPFREAGGPAALSDPRPDRRRGGPGRGPNLQDFIGHDRVGKGPSHSCVHDVPHGPRNPEKTQEPVPEAVENKRDEFFQGRDSVVGGAAVVGPRGTTVTGSPLGRPPPPFSGIPPPTTSLVRRGRASSAGGTPDHAMASG